MAENHALTWAASWIGKTDAGQPDTSDMSLLKYSVCVFLQNSLGDRSQMATLVIISRDWKVTSTLWRLGWSVNLIGSGMCPGDWGGTLLGMLGWVTEVWS